MIDLDKLQALRERHERLCSDYSTRAGAARLAAGEVEHLRADLLVGVKSGAAIELIRSNCAELLKYPADKLKASQVDVRQLRKLIAAQASLATARDDAVNMAAMVRESAALIERLNKFAQRSPEAA